MMVCWSKKEKPKICDITKINKEVTKNTQIKKIRTLDLANEDRTYSGFSYFMDGSRRGHCQSQLHDARYGD